MSAIQCLTVKTLVPPAIFNQEPCFGVLTNSILSIIAGLSGVNISYKADFLWHQIVLHQRNFLADGYICLQYKRLLRPPRRGAIFNYYFRLPPNGSAIIYKSTVPSVYTIVCIRYPFRITKRSTTLTYQLFW